MNTQQIRTDLFNILSTLDKDTECESVYFDLFARYATLALESGAYYETLWDEVAHITETYKIRAMDDFELSDEALSSVLKLMKGFEDDDPNHHGAVVELIRRECDKQIGHHLHYGHYVLGNFYSYSAYYDNCFYQLMLCAEEHVKRQAALQAAYDGVDKLADQSALPKDLLVGLGNVVKTKLESGEFEVVNIGLLDELKSVCEDDVACVEAQEETSEEYEDSYW